MLQDLAALAPPAIVCVAFLIGAWMLLRHELGPKRRSRAGNGDGGGAAGQGPHERGERSES
jgi:hypothetical protein